jgi:hypothetical protein
MQFSEGIAALVKIRSHARPEPRDIYIDIATLTARARAA